MNLRRTIITILAFTLSLFCLAGCGCHHKRLGTTEDDNVGQDFSLYVRQEGLAATADR